MFVSGTHDTVEWRRRFRAEGALRVECPFRVNWALGWDCCLWVMRQIGQVRPNSRIVPASGRIRPKGMRSIVVLPAEDPVHLPLRNFVDGSGAAKRPTDPAVGLFTR